VNAHPKAQPKPKFNYLDSRKKTEFLIDNIKRYYRDRGFTDFDIWSEREVMGNSHIWVVRSTLSEKMGSL